MVDPRDYKIAGLAMAFGWSAKKLMAFWLALPVSVQTFLQGLITLAIGLAAVIAQHFLRRYLKRNWPEEALAQNVAPTRSAAPGRARFNLLGLVRRLFDLVRRKISPLRKAKRGRKEF